MFLSTGLPSLLKVNKWTDLKLNIFPKFLDILSMVQVLPYRESTSCDWMTSLRQ